MQSDSSATRFLSDPSTIKKGQILVIDALTKFNCHWYLIGGFYRCIDYRAEKPTFHWDSRPSTVPGDLRSRASEIHVDVVNA